VKKTVFVTNYKFVIFERYGRISYVIGHIPQW